MLNAYYSSVKASYCMIPIIWHSGKGEIMETEEGTEVVRVLAGEDF